MAHIDWHTALAEHERWLTAVVLARVGERAAVDEVMQEVALAAVRQKAPLADPTKLAPWLYRLAVTQALLFRRKSGRRRRMTARYAQRGSESVSGGDPLAWLLAEERRTLLWEALGRMPGRDAEILLLKYTENWSYAQLAEHLGVTASAIEARLHRARRRLRSELAPVVDNVVNQ